MSRRWPALPPEARIGQESVPARGAQGMHYLIEWANAITGREVRISMRTAGTARSRWLNICS
eukprot:1954001-Amphidinium_carterae.1